MICFCTRVSAGQTSLRAAWKLQQDLLMCSSAQGLTLSLIEGDILGDLLHVFKQEASSAV